MMEARNPIVCHPEARAFCEPQDPCNGRVALPLRLLQRCSFPIGVAHLEWVFRRHQSVVPSREKLFSPFGSPGSALVGYSGFWGSACAVLTGAVWPRRIAKRESSDQSG